VLGGYAARGVCLALLLAAEGCGSSSATDRDAGSDDAGGCALLGSCSCALFGSACTEDDDCCGAWGCENGTCQTVCRADGSHCAGPSTCCSAFCNDGVCGEPRCAPQGGSCGNTDDCCANLSCKRPNGTDVEDAGGADAGGTCQSGCGGQHDSCSGDTCCSGLRCDEALVDGGVVGLCFALCQGFGQSCNDDNDCCQSSYVQGVGFVDETCVQGRCVACGYSLTECTAQTMCCGGTCESGECKCQTKGQACSKQGDCCEYLQCEGGKCTCLAAGAACASDVQCCVGLTCQSGECAAIGCFAAGQTCFVGTEGPCCNGDCGSDGLCCRGSGFSCDADRPCCTVADPVSTCIEGVCTDCLQDGASCMDDAHCCGGQCENGLCCANQVGAYCGSSAGMAPCCSGLTCTDQGTCAAM
jgi:hypothetical protein